MLVTCHLSGLSDTRSVLDEAIRLIELYQTRYRDFTVAHFHDKYQDEHQGQRSYTWLKNQPQEHQLVQKAKKKGAHRRKRERTPMSGMMLHQDGSTHQWAPGKYWDLIVTLDDATSEIYSAFFVEEEGTLASLPLR